MSVATDNSLEIALMQLIRQQMGSHILRAVLGTPFTESFVASLAANECNGNASATRYEAAELGRFAEVLAARRTNYQGITSEMLMGEIVRGIGLPSIGGSVGKLMNLCTSWGPTQIMGWQSLKGKYPISELLTLDTHFPHCVALLRDFQIDFHLQTDDKTQLARSLFDCWNTGRPSGVTTDPQYIAKGMARMALYEGLR